MNLLSSLWSFKPSLTLLKGNVKKIPPIWASC
jgi:hypothetical protein